MRTSRSKSNLDDSAPALRVAIRGAGGRMGLSAQAALGEAVDLDFSGAIEASHAIAARVEELRADVLVDLTRPDALDTLEDALPGALRVCRAVVIGTSGVDEARLERWSGILDGLDDDRALLVVPNFCVGLVLLQRFAVEAGLHFADVEISEAHHEKKADSPSGTAVDTARRIARTRSVANTNQDRGPARGAWCDEVPVHSLRLPGTLARQIVEFGGSGELLTLRHDTLSREAFMPGLLRSIRAATRMSGLHVGLEHALDAET